MQTTPAKSSRIPFDSLTLRVVVTELREMLLGGQVQDIRQPSDTDLLLGIHSHGRNYLLHLSCEARYARVHLSRRRLPNPTTPPHFCMVLRKWMENGHITDLRQRDFDRIFEIEIDRKNEAGESQRFTLIAELMGKHSNLILVNEKGTVLDAAKRITHRINRLRETLPGLPYLPPPAQNDRLDPFAPGTLAHFTSVENDKLAELLLATCAGLSPFLAGEIAARAASQGLETAWQEIFGAIAREKFSPVLVRDSRERCLGAYPLPLRSLPEESQEQHAELNATLGIAYQEMIEQGGYDTAYTDLLACIERERKRTERQKQSLEKTLEEAERAEQHKQTGELILANIWQIEEGAESVTVQDYYAPDYPQRTLELDPKLNPQENAEHWFRRYRKARDSGEFALTQVAAIEATLKALDTERVRLTTLVTEKEVREMKARLLRTELLHSNTEQNTETHKEQGPDFQGHKIRRVTTPEGYEILIGESATANDFLTTRIAAPNDFWLHVRAAASSHVVVRTKGHPESVPRSVLEEAARLCVRHSAQKHSSLVSVDYTLKKYVRKPRNSAPGAADYQREITLNVSP